MGLSSMMVEEVGRIIDEVHERGVTVLLVEQNACLALRLADTAYVLEVGKVAMRGDSKTIANDEYITKCYLGTSRSPRAWSTTLPTTTSYTDAMTSGSSSRASSFFVRTIN
jgi:ABC-type cobalamin/Fe3+-siderophores transport system ATPase subunit